MLDPLRNELKEPLAHPDWALAERMGKSARLRIEESFSIERMTRNVEDVYLRLLASRVPAQSGEH